MVFSGKCSWYIVQCKVQVFFSDVDSHGPLTYTRSGDSTSKCCYNNDNIIIKGFSGFKGAVARVVF
jgi:hypothetical protein